MYGDRTQIAIQKFSKNISYMIQPFSCYIICSHACARDVRVSRPLFCSRSRSYGIWSWSRPRSHEVLVSVSYVFVSWSQIKQLFLKCSDFWPCSVFC